MPLRVLPLPEDPARWLPTVGYDAAIAAVGFEQRSSALLALLGERPERALAVEFDAGRDEVFDANRQAYVDAGWDVVPDEGSFERRTEELLRTLPSRSRVLVDISSMSRDRVGAVVAALAELDDDSDVVCDLVYQPADYLDPPSPPAAVLKLRPTSPFYAGTLDAEASTTCIVGLGYEPEKAAGTIETLEASEVIAFVPHDPAGDFLPKVEAANHDLLHGRYEAERHDYDIDDPFGCFVALEQLVVDLIDAGRRPALVPLGPKIFAACCLLVGARHQEEVSVWRASFREGEERRDHRAAGPVYGLRVVVGDVPSVEI